VDDYAHAGLVLRDLITTDVIKLILGQQVYQARDQQGVAVL